MQLPSTAEYAIRAMAHMATLPSGTAVRSKDLSKATGIPAHYLSKILRKLVLEGLLVSRKGHGGGFELARALEDTPFVDILGAVGMEVIPDRCAFGWGNCNHDKPCPLHAAWSRFNDAVWQWATQTTLADVTQYDEDTLAFLREHRDVPGD